MKKVLSSIFSYTKSQQRGIIVLFCICFILQMIIFFVNFQQVSKVTVSSEAKNWLDLQGKLDRLKEEQNGKSFELKPFNPNFISDYKGYKLGMSVDEIDRLFAFRKHNKYVNSAREFQNVTGVSDSLLAKMAPFFKFPAWVNARNNKIAQFSNNKYFKKESKTVVKKDINQASIDDLIAVRGLGEVLSTRILKYKERLGFFVNMNQLQEVWGLSPEVVSEINKNFTIINSPAIKKIAINELSLKELSQFVYFKYPIAKQIVMLRSMNGNIKNIDELSKIKDFPVDKASIINLYLEF